MEKTIESKQVYAKTYVMNENKTKRYELTIAKEPSKKANRKILVIGLNPSSNDLEITDMTTNYITNNLFPLGYTDISICNLTALASTSFKVSDIVNNEDNLSYIENILSREYHTILIGYGSSYSSNKKIQEEKEKIGVILQKVKEKSNIVELVDDKNVYSRLNNIHPLFAGQRFSGHWKFRKYVF